MYYMYIKLATMQLHPMGVLLYASSLSAAMDPNYSVSGICRNSCIFLLITNLFLVQMATNIHFQTDIYKF